MEQILNSSMRSCCGATLAGIEEPQEPSNGDDGGVLTWAFIVVGVVGLVLLIVLVTAAALLIRRKKSSRNDTYHNRNLEGRGNLGFQK